MSARALKIFAALYFVAAIVTLYTPHGAASTLNLLIIGYIHLVAAWIIDAIERGARKG